MSNIKLSNYKDTKQIIFLFEILFALLSLISIPGYLCVYIYFFNFLYIIFNVKKFYHGWFLFCLGIYLYSIPHFFNFFILGNPNPLYTINESINLIGNGITYNLKGINYINIIITSLIIPQFFLKSNLLIVKTNININKPAIISLIAFFSLILIFGLRRIDYQSIENSYAVPEGSSFVFGVYYWLNFLFSIVFLFLLYKNKDLKIYFIIILLYQFILFYLGVRQISFWFILTLVVEWLLFKKMTTGKIHLNISFIAFFVLFAYVMGIITTYRFNKQFSFELLMPLQSIEMFIYAYFAETSLTLYNLFACIYESMHGNDFFFFPEIKDTFIMIIPSWLFEKNSFLSFAIFDNKYNVAPFGTYFIVGELILSLRYKILIFMFGFIYSLMGYFLLNKFLIKTSILKITVYASALIILYIRPIRGLLAPSFKIFLIFVLFVYFIIKIFTSLSNQYKSYTESIQNKE